MPLMTAKATGTAYERYHAPNKLEVLQLVLESLVGMEQCHAHHKPSPNSHVAQQHKVF